MEQAGARPGRSAIEMGLHKVVVLKTVRLQRLYGGIIYNDAKACYARIIENISNIAFLQHGLPVNIAKLHSQTFRQITYTIKHKLGLSTTSHKHNHLEPVYGVGQWACDAPARWGFACGALINAYKQVANNAEIISSISRLKSNHKIAALVNDTMTMKIIHKQLCFYILWFLQSDVQNWEKLLYTSGRKLEIPKCKFGVIDWEYDNLGRVTLKSNTKSVLNVTNSKDSTNMTIPQLDTYKAYRYVGIYFAIDGNQIAQLNDLATKCNKMSIVFSRLYFKAKDSEQGFMTIYCPLTKCAFPTT
jgi:hypothetical protein